jgi:hypothetical protein
MPNGDGTFRTLTTKPADETGHEIIEEILQRNVMSGELIVPARGCMSVLQAGRCTPCTRNELKNAWLVAYTRRDKNELAVDNMRASS